jgi:hypothetical protein
MISAKTEKYGHNLLMDYSHKGPISEQMKNEIKLMIDKMFNCRNELNYSLIKYCKCLMMR